MVDQRNVFSSKKIAASCTGTGLLSAEQNDNQLEEINVIDESQAENRPVPVQEAAIFLDEKTFLWSTNLQVCCA